MRSFALDCLPDDVLFEHMVPALSYFDAASLLRTSKDWKIFVCANNTLWRKSAFEIFAPLHLPNDVPLDRWYTVARQNAQVLYELRHRTSPASASLNDFMPTPIEDEDMSLVLKGETKGETKLREFMFTFRLFDGDAGAQLVSQSIRFGSLCELKKATGFPICEKLRVALQDADAMQHFWEKLRLEIIVTRNLYSFVLFDKEIADHLDFYHQVFSAPEAYPSKRMDQTWVFAQLDVDDPLRSIFLRVDFKHMHVEDGDDTYQNMSEQQVIALLHSLWRNRPLSKTAHTFNGSDAPVPELETRLAR